MRWWPGRGRSTPPPYEGDGSFQEALHRSLVVSRLHDLLEWGEKGATWPFDVGLSCCYTEMATGMARRYDASRFNPDTLKSIPQESDLMVVAGTVSTKLAPTIHHLYQQMKEPRWVVSLGSCANSGGMYDVYGVVQGIDRLLPVDLYVEGCPPRAESFMEGLHLLLKAMGNEKRPLERAAGHWGADRAPVMRDVKRFDRQRIDSLRPPLST